MINGKKVVVVLPAFNASSTLETTFNEIPMEIVDEVVLVDDASPDNTVEVGMSLGIKHIVKHENNRGYGGNQKSCYNKALELGADIVIAVNLSADFRPQSLVNNPIDHGNNQKKTSDFFYMFI